ncbi:aspartyl-tRNA(Asn)/glutamyl-tRNA(Gln) amidotransferase subunit A [Clostridium tetanomorphum]|uniref:Glutamyl-tRNA(Gln) amidotransferase subunit A n=2 Tax=Clostridium TaxID=1485 RepID=A0A923EAY9_CLOTT|nr:Asp-tRNA(Asn)/Glu-tRNA(Gln) amidotransferase subunit GatA [Clostridium tetanomorphum]KAJ52887.1 aspartyl/glutamyl-tRNA amidotransferase subunit A [Clostridium tetanomorphum DSM 665]MBC2399902.1 Asp-tRNA(Asn)/Glu-tRNA(Gln) amidotransferase subunit GatA [Clostridium tetanomorphum]MBP1865975.1 aspartyl-tRNA(Asn)/glutamyl-tRNA(Gln) amidotransferase subunit A [Clostridium tetanomorphum]NRS85971.1 aspartyl-tRNA(Asn)/glutamyl-tRNA(Gln) amidotransferase subunit A [Clostridium tetanomorphum]NRZ96019
MELYNLKAHELKDMISKKEVKVEEVVNSHLNRIEALDSKLGAFLYDGKEEALDMAKNIDNKIAKGEKLKGLSGIPVSIKDNISVKGMQNTCASKMLEGYVATYDAHVIERIKEEDGVILGKLNMDEFAMGSSTENSAYKSTRNPWDIERVPGGSSGGSAVAVAAMETPLSLGTDTGGSVRQPAALCGVVGLKPTYGRISRYGAVAFGSTLDQIGILGRDVEDCSLLTQNIAGIDNKDFTTANIPVPDYSKFLTKDIKGKKIGIPKEFFGEGLDKDVRKAIEEAIKVLEDNGAEVKFCSLPLTDYALAAYYIISSAEASSNLARFDGIRYGHRTENYSDAIDIYFKSRDEGFGKEVKRRIMLGTYVLSAGYYDAYYKKALKVRNLIKEDYGRIFKEFDAIISPTSPTTAFKIGEKVDDVLSMYLSDVYTVPVSVAGLPAISVPCGMVNGLPVGLQIIGNYYKEDTLFNLAYSFEQSTDWHNMKPQL